MSTRGDLTISKEVVGDCKIENEIQAGDDITYEITVENSSSEQMTVNIFDELCVFSMEALSWVGVDVGFGTTTGSAGAGADLIDETLVLGPCATFLYTVVVTTKDPFCGVVHNVVRYCTPDMKRPEYIAAEPVYVGIQESEACLDNEGRNANDIMFELIGTGDKLVKLMAIVEAGFCLADFFNLLGKQITGEDSSAKPLNEDYEGFIEMAKEREALAERQAEAEARRQAAVDAAGDTAARAAE